MRKIILFMVMSLDGFVAGPKGELDWEIQNPEIGMFLIPELLKTVDSMIIGRVLYQGFQSFWPNVAKDPKTPKELADFANWLENWPKFVVSKTLEKAEWNNSTIIHAQTDEQIVEKITALKQTEGGDIVLFGGIHLSQTLARLNLVDEYRFKIQPIALGSGQPLFKDLKNRLKLKLIFSKTFESGVVATYYRPIQ